MCLIDLAEKFKGWSTAYQCAYAKYAKEAKESEEGTKLQNHSLYVLLSAVICCIADILSNQGVCYAVAHHIDEMHYAEFQLDHSIIK